MNPVVARWLAAGICAAAFAGAAPALADPSPEVVAAAVTAPADAPAPVTYRLPSRLELTGPARTETTPTLRTTARLAGYVLQAFDAAQSARGLRLGGRETNPMMKPFSHGGAMTMGLGFAVGDLIRGAVLRRSSNKVKIAADVMQGVSNVQGLIATEATIHGGGLH